MISISYKNTIIVDKQNVSNKRKRIYKNIIIALLPENQKKYRIQNIEYRNLYIQFMCKSGFFKYKISKIYFKYLDDKNEIINLNILCT